MVQLEMEKLADQRKDLQLMLDKWSQIDFSTPDSRVKVGSLVVTSSGIFLLAVALGTTMFEAENVVVLSSLSPLAQQLIGKTINDEIKVNNHLYKIIAIQ